MKKILLAQCLTSVALLTGCNLDLEPLDKLADQNYYNNRKELEVFTNGFYADFPTAENLYSETADIIVPTTLSTEVMGTRTVPQSGGGWSWGQLSNINTFLKDCSRCNDEAARKEFEAVARFFRAYFYYDKVKRFGEVPWFDEPLSSTNDRLYAPRTPRNELINNILADLDFAAENLPSAKNLYRVTKWTALALKSRVCLYEGTWRKYHGFEGHETYLKAAAEAAEMFIDNSPYTIYNAGEQPYRDLFAADKAKAEEVILARNYNSALSIVHSANLYFLSGGASPGMNKKVVNSYLMKDGTRFTDLPNYNSMQYYDEMQNRDPRLAQTIVTPGYKRIGESTVTSVNFGATTTGYQIIKWVSTTASDGYNKSQNDIPLFRTAEVMLNFAEAKAELGTLTQADLDKSVKKLRDRVGMPNINLASANSNPDPYLEANETGYPNVSGANKGVILEIRRERTIELVAEGLRYDDLMRWKAGKTFEKQFKGMFIPALDANKHFVVCDLNGNGIADAQDVCVYEGDLNNVKTYSEVANITQFLKLGVNLQLANGNNGGNIIVHDIANKQRSWNETRDYLYPIPQDQITLYGGIIKQNPEW